MFHFFRILYLALYVLCFLAAFAACYTAVVVYRQGGGAGRTAVWAAGGVLLAVLAVLLYRIYRRLSGR